MPQVNIALYQCPDNKSSVETKVRRGSKQAGRVCQAVEAKSDGARILFPVHDPKRERLRDR
jgi:hypothetical protein